MEHDLDMMEADIAERDGEIERLNDQVRVFGDLRVDRRNLITS